MLQVVDKFIGELGTQLADRNVVIKVSSAARKELAKIGYDPLFGARPLGRLIQTEIRRSPGGKDSFRRSPQGGRSQDRL